MDVEGLRCRACGGPVLPITSPPISNSRRAAYARRFALPTAFAALLLAPLAGCDSDGSTGAEVTIQGRVTSEVPSGSGGAGGPVEGATVVAARVTSDGALDALDGQATTDADGAFTLTTEGTTDAVVLTATEGSDFRARALLEAGAARSGTLTASPLTVETTAEADVYLDLRARSSAATAADVVFYVTGEVAERIDANETTAAEFAAAIDAIVEAEAAYDGTGDRADEVEDERTQAYATLRASLAAATTADARRAASRAYEAAYAGAAAEAGATAEVQTGAALAAAKAAVRFSTDLPTAVSFSLERQARIYATQAAALAAEAAFRTNGAETSRLNALAAARTTLLTEVVNAADPQAVAAAEATYRAAVRAELAAETDLTQGQIEVGQNATASARASLETALSTATTTGAVATAVEAFYASARSAVAAALGTGNDFAVDVVTYTSLGTAAVS
jgi:hypothetical protein